MPEEGIKPGDTGDKGGGGDGGNTTPAFNELFPKEHRETFKSFEDANGFVTHYKEVTGKVKDLEGKVPVIPDTYEDVEGVTVPDEAKQSLENLQKFAKDDLGLSQAQYNKFLKATIQHDVKMVEDLKKGSDEEFDKLLKEQEKEAIAELKQDWGGDYDTKIKQVQGFIAASGDEELIEYLSETGLGNDPRLVKWAYKMSTHFKEDAFVDGKIEVNDVIRGDDGRPQLKFKKME